MDAPYEGGAGVHVLPSGLPLGGAGVFPVNAYVLLGEEPVLIDTGMAIDGDDFVDALASVVDPAALRWVWLTHDDPDHTGSIRRVLELAPRARLATQAFTALRMAMWWRVPLDRVHAIRVGDRLQVAGRTLRAVAPPLYDNPRSTGVLDEATGALFPVDAFGAILPEPARDVAEVPDETLAGAMRSWASSDSPWTHLVDRRRFAEVLEGVRRLRPSRIFPSHLPVAGPTSLERFLQVLGSVPDAEPSVEPDDEAFAELASALAPVPDGREPEAGG